MNLKTVVQATEDTEKKRIPHLLQAHLMGVVKICGKQLFCELCNKPPIPACPISSVSSAFSVANVKVMGASRFAAKRPSRLAGWTSRLPECRLVIRRAGDNKPMSSRV